MRTQRATFARDLLHPGSLTRTGSDAGRDDHVALITDDGPITRAELVERVATRSAELDLAFRSVVILTGPPSLEWVVTYLALLEAEHVPLLAADHVEDLATAWRPAAVVTTSATSVHIDRRCHDDQIQSNQSQSNQSHDNQSHDPSGSSIGDDPIHPDLALLLSTSGSTGATKLVRLSHENLSTNAHAIIDSLALGPDDRGITSLPLHYCYGLSVLHAHLVAGASVVVTSASVVDPCFRRALDEHQVTNVAGVPHTFELLERTDPERLHVPSLRLITQAGGKLPACDVTRWLDRANRWGVDFVVMYGQTEATARIAYLDPAIARRRPEAIGQAIPGGELRLAPLDDAIEINAGHGLADVGELVYRGPNVMLGYATSLADLRLGRTVDELHTGDLARFHADDGVFEIVGRRSRFVKPFGLRIDLDYLERRLVADGGHEVAVSGDDDGLAVLAPGAHAPDVIAAVAGITKLPRARIAVATDQAIPRTSSDKVDNASVLRIARTSTSTSAISQRALADGRVADGRVADRGEADRGESVAAIYASVLGRSDVGLDDTFVGLGGDSLSYVECSIRLEAALGRVPDDWHLMPISAFITENRHRFARLDTTVLLRAIGICAVVSTHMRLWHFPGGAHLLLAVVGFNLSRFLLPIEGTRGRLIGGMRTAARAAIPTITWIAFGAAAGASQGLGTVLLINNYVGPTSHSGDHWHFWFIEVFVHLVVLTTLLLAVPAVRRADARFPYLVPLSIFLALLVLRMEWAQMGDWYNMRYRTHGVAWLFALGWLVHRSTTQRTRLLTAGLCIATIPGFFQYAPREWFITACLVLLLWRRDVPIPRAVVRPLAIIAAASMWIYISHFSLWPPFVDALGVRAAYIPTILGGIAIWAIAQRVTPPIIRAARRAHDVARRPSVVRMA